MTQVDLEIIACSDRKIACEAVIEGSDLPRTSPASSPPDLPAESFRLPTVEDEIDWVDRNAFLQRKQSTKALSTSTSLPTSTLRPPPPSAKSKPFIGLPKCPHLPQPSRRPAACAVRFFPDASSANPRPPRPEVEPSSPKVSCIGRVRPKTKSSRNLRPRSPPPPQPPQRRDSRLFGSCLGSLGRRKKQPTPALNDGRSPAAAKLEPGRRAADVAGGDSKGDDSVWRRRAVGPPEPVDCARDWASVGPATV